MSYDFADRLIEMRKSKDLSQEELAKRLGVSRQAISKWERAESTPDIANLLALADLYDTSLDDLVRGTSGDSLKETASSAQGITETATPSQAPTEAASNGTTQSEPAAESNTSNNQFPPPPSDARPLWPPTPAPAPSATPAYAPTPTPAPAPAPQPATQLEKNPLLTFPYPIFIVLAYLILGFCFGLWHPGWIIFFTIPFYYWIISVIKHDPEYIARHTVPKQ